MSPLCDVTDYCLDWSEAAMKLPARRSRFVMKIKDIFKFEDGRTVFAGVVVDGPKYISAGDCELFVNDELEAAFRIEGEMIPLRRPRSDLRAVSTTEDVDTDRIRRIMEQCELRWE